MGKQHEKKKYKGIERACGGKMGKNGLGKARYGKQEKQADGPRRGGNDVYR